MKFVKYIFFVVLALSIAAHFLYLDRLPVGLSHDEVEYILSSRQYWHTGTDLSNVAFPLSIIKTQTEGIISFLPALLLAPYFGLVKLNLFTVHLPYILISLLSAFVLYCLARRLFKDSPLALITPVVYLINPWSFYLSRTATDTAFALLFCLLGLYFTLSEKRKYFYLSLFFYVAMFFSYHGAKVIFLPLVIISLIYFYFSHIKKNILKFSFYFILSFAILISFYVLASTPGSILNSRTKDILLPNNSEIIKTVNNDRLLTIANPFTPIFSNKISVYISVISQKYLTAFSPDILFISGDQRATYRFGRFGLFYLFDLIFLCLGVCLFIKRHPKQGIFLVSLIIIAPLATAVSTVETSVINRSFLLLPIFVLFISYGILSVLKCISQIQIPYRPNNRRPLLTFFCFFFLFLFFSLSLDCSRKLFLLSKSSW